MANLTAKIVSTYFNAHDVKHELTGEDEDIILTGYTAENKKVIDIAILFDESETTCRLVTRDYCHVPEQKKETVILELNKLNAYYRWAKFYLDEDGDIRIDTDAVVDQDTCGQECHELVRRLVGIGDDAYPQIMKAIWT